MEKNYANIFSTIIVIFLLVLLVPFPILGANGACVSYSSSSKTITISCTSETHLNDVNNAINDPTILKKESNGVWLLAANLVVAKGGNLIIDSSDTTWLKIVSGGTVAFGLKNSGDLKIDTVKITSWNIATNAYASPGSDGQTPRAYIVASGGGVGKMNILDSEIAYLGYTGTGHHGLDYYGSDGSLIQNNHIHHNWRAFYSSQVGGLRFDYNDVHDNLEYGVDPHTATHDMYITYNKSYNNNHGIICSQRCYNLHIENNEIYANNRDGIYLDAGSHHITIANNNIHEEETAIQLPSLSSSEVYGNTITNSKYGIKLYTQIGSDYDTSGACGSIGCGSSNNNVHNNKITASSTGIEVRDGAASNNFESNTINGATTGRGIVVEGATTSDNVFKSNHISSASYGMKLTSGNTNSRFVDNYFDSVVSSGEYTLASSSTLKVENTKFSSDVIKAVDTTSNPVSISNSGVISVIDGATGKTTNYDTTSQAYTRTLASNAKITVTSNSQDTTPPAQVTGLSVSTVSSTQLNLAWTQSSASDFDHYNVYRGTSSGFSVNPSTTPPIGTSIANSYSSTGLNPSTKYYYKVAAVDNAGNIGALSSENSGTTAAAADTTPPAQVTGLSVSTVSSTQLNLAWTQSSASDFDHYNVYRGTSSGFSVTPGVTLPTGTSSTNSYSNTGLNPSTRYSYKVAAVDNAGNIGALSSENSGTTAAAADTTPPAQVTGLSVSTVSSTQLNLAWTQSSASDFDHYNVYRGTSSGFSVTPGVTVPTGTSSTNSYSNTGLNPSTKYYYKVAAVDNAGNIGALSSENSGTTAAAADTTPPAQVTGLSVSTVSSTQLNLAWTQSSASDFDHYNVYRGTSSGFSVTPGVTVPTGTSSTNSYSNTGLNPSTKYYYKVAAVDNAGNIGALSSENSGTTAAAADTTPPAQVTGLSVSTVSSTQLNLAWTQSSASDFDHYNVYRGTSSGFSVNPSTTPPIGTSIANSYSSTGLNPSTKYYYKVAAVDNAGNIGALSSENSGTTAAPADTTPPAQVTGLSVSTVSSTQLNLAWTQSSASDFDHYNVYRGTSSGFSVNPSTTPPIGTSIANSYSSTGLNPSTKYYYKVAAVDNAGNIGALSSENSGTTAAAADTTPPAQVTGLSVSTVSSTQLNLAWTQSSASDFNHYNVYRGTSSGFSVTPGVTVPTGTSSTNSYSNTGLNPSTKYYYKVAAVDNAGNIGPLSSQVSKTTAAADTTPPSADTTPPARVTGLKVSTVSSTQLNLAWTRSSASDFNHYNVYRGTSSGFKITLGETVPTGTSSTNSYSNTGLNPSTKYSYRVAAVDNAGNIGPLSSQVSKTTAALSSSSSSDRTPPAQVTGLTISTVSSTQLNLACSRSSASDFNHYNIYKSTTSGFTVTPGVTVPTGTSSTNSYSNTGLNPSTKYSYRVAAVDNAGNIGPLSSQVSKTTAALSSSSSSDRTPPAQVTGLTISTVSSTQLNLAWSRSSASDFNHYNIYKSTTSGFTVTPGVTVPTGTSSTNSYSNTGLNPSTKYSYRVAAVDNAGNIGPLSSQVSKTTAAIVVTSQLSKTTAAAVGSTNNIDPLSSEKSGTTGDNQGSVGKDTRPPGRVSAMSIKTISHSQLDLKWSTVKDSDLNHYNIYIGTSSKFSVKPGATSPIGTSTASSYHSTGLNPSTKYYYKVAAVDNAGNIGPLSSEKSGTTGDNQGSVGKDTRPPGRVSAMSIKTISHSQLDLKWSTVKDSDLNHYNIYIGTSSKFSVKPGATSPIGTSTASSYHSTGLNPSTKYYYKVAAVDNAGNIGPLSSTRSGETGDAPSSKSRSTSETAVTIADIIRENSNTDFPTQDDREGPTKSDNTTEVDAEHNTSDESPSIDKTYVKRDVVT